MDNFLDLLASKITLGGKEGHIKHSDQYTDCIDNLEHVCLGVWIGTINCEVTEVADDEFLMSYDPLILLGLIRCRDICKIESDHLRINFQCNLQNLNCDLF